MGYWAEIWIEDILCWALLLIYFTWRQFHKRDVKEQPMAAANEEDFRMANEMKTLVQTAGGNVCLGQWNELAPSGDCWEIGREPVEDLAWWTELNSLAELAQVRVWREQWTIWMELDRELRRL